MLIQFSVKNWRSVRDEQTLSMVKAKGGELLETNTFQPTALATESLLRSAVVYGPNAAGKSNLLTALRSMRLVVVNSAVNKQEGDELPVVPFLLDETTENMPTEFEAIFVSQGVRYQYGFAATKSHVIEEWLIAFPNGRPQRWFERNWLEEKNEYNWTFGGSLLGQKQLWLDSTRNNALFLSTATQLNSQQLKPVFSWFKNTLSFSKVSGWSPTYTASLCTSEETQSRVVEFLAAADLDIKGVRVTSEPMSMDHLPDSLPDEVKRHLFDKLENQKQYDIKMIHKGAQGQDIEFDFKEESDGTKKFFSFAGPWLDVLRRGRVLAVDELHDNLHPRLVKFLVEVFHSNVTNPNNAQLIFTTHETSILNQDVFRRDQIWFCEKGDDQATKLYPLTDFSPKKGREDLEAAYLAGRYGALPFVRPLKQPVN